MIVNPISFNGKTPKTSTIQTAYKKALVKIFGQSDKDYFNLSKNIKSQQNIPTDFVEKSKNFFSGFFG